MFLKCSYSVKVSQFLFNLGEIWSFSSVGSWG
jgi:hypothetical protein